MSSTYRKDKTGSFSSSVLKRFVSNVPMNTEYENDPVLYLQYVYDIFLRSKIFKKA